MGMEDRMVSGEKGFEKFNKFLEDNSQYFRESDIRVWVSELLKGLQYWKQVQNWDLDSFKRFLMRLSLMMPIYESEVNVWIDELTELAEKRKKGME